MDSRLSIKIISKPSQNQDYFVVYKPSGLPSAPLSEQDEFNAFSQTAKLFPELLKVEGRKKIEHGLIHRIDTVTEGLIIIAASQKSYEELIQLQKENKIVKYYRASCTIDKTLSEGFPKYSEIFKYNPGDVYKIQSYFRPFGEGHKAVRPVTENSGEAALKKIGKKILYSTEIKIIENSTDNIKVDCKIVNGYRHQVRCHLSWIGLPIIGDPIYNKESNESKIKFTAYKIDVNGQLFELNLN